MKRKDDSLRGQLLACARGIADTEGIEAVNIRLIAQRAGVATGTIYSYFSGKDEILLALTEEYWRKTLGEMEAAMAAGSLWGQLEEIYAFLRARIERYAGSLMNSIGNPELAGQARMMSALAELERTLVGLMERDENIRSDIWDESFTKPQFAHFIVTNMLVSLREKAPDIPFLLQLVKHTIY